MVPTQRPGPAQLMRRTPLPCEMRTGERWSTSRPAGVAVGCAVLVVVLGADPVVPLLAAVSWLALASVAVWPPSPLVPVWVRVRVSVLVPVSVLLPPVSPPPVSPPPVSPPPVPPVLVRSGVID